MSNKEYMAALYLRLSKEDGDKEESDSIANQRALGMDFIGRNTDIKLYDEFSDDGYTGSNFERPRFQDMIDLILQGKINCVVVKDLSRFAREYIDAGYYLEKLFPAIGVRFISINDNIDYKVDSSNNTKLIVAFKNILNDSYIRDTSVKIRSHLEVKRQSGAYIGAFVVMGYKKSEEDKHKIVIDKEAAVLIKQIFSLYFMGISATAIAHKLNIENVPSPAEYKKLSGSKFKANAQKRHKAQWSAKAVIRILKNEIYTGTLIQGKNTTANYKVKKVIERDRGEWSVIPNNHEAIISKEQFDTVQRLIANDTRVKPGNKTPYLFSGFIECADCHSSLVRRCNKSNDKIYACYMCSTNKLGLGCSSHRVNENVLHIAVLTAVNTYCKNISDLSVKLNRISLDKIKTAQTKRIDDAEKKKKNDIDDLKHTISVVKARCLENLETQAACNEICADIYNEIARLEDEILKLSVEKNNVLSEYEKNIAWIAAFTQMGELKELNRTVLARLVDRIYVYDDKRIVIRFNYQDKYEELLKFEQKLNKEAV